MPEAALAHVDGEVAPGFEKVREAFENNFSAQGDVGAAVSVYVKGEKVVDLWGGVADAETGRPWERDTTVMVFSTTKGATAICAHLLAQRGELDLDAPVSSYWPEFKAEGKEHMPVRWLLGHRAGLPVVSGEWTEEQMFAWEPIVAGLAAERPVWEPGTDHGYHAVTYGWLVGEVIRRVAGRSVGRFFADEIARPLDLDFWIGLPEALEERVAPLITFEGLGEDGPSQEFLDSLPEEMREIIVAYTDPTSLTQRALSITGSTPDMNGRTYHAAEIPAVNGIGTARALARLYAACIGEIDGFRLLDDATVQDACREQSNGRDRILLVDTRFGSGFFLSSTYSPMLGPTSFGHAGAGGSLAFADVESGVGFAYVMNKMLPNLSGDPRTVMLVDAVRRSL